MTSSTIVLHFLILSHFTIISSQSPTLNPTTPPTLSKSSNNGSNNSSLMISLVITVVIVIILLTIAVYCIIKTNKNTQNKRPKIEKVQTNEIHETKKTRTENFQVQKKTSNSESKKSKSDEKNKKEEKKENYVQKLVIEDKINENIIENENTQNDIKINVTQLVKMETIEENKENQPFSDISDVEEIEEFNEVLRLEPKLSLKMTDSTHEILERHVLKILARNSEINAMNIAQNSDLDTPMTIMSKDIKFNSHFSESEEINSPLSDITISPPPQRAPKLNTPTEFSSTTYNDSDIDKDFDEYKHEKKGSIHLYQHNKKFTFPDLSKTITIRPEIQGYLNEKLVSYNVSLKKLPLSKNKSYESQVSIDDSMVSYDWNDNKFNASGEISFGESTEMESVRKNTNKTVYSNHRPKLSISEFRMLQQEKERLKNLGIFKNKTQFSGSTEMNSNNLEKENKNNQKFIE